MKLGRLFSKPERKNGKEKEKDTTTDDVGGVARCVDVHKVKTSGMK
jgi:hypothetical protein